MVTIPELIRSMFVRYVCPHIWFVSNAYPSFWNIARYYLVFLRNIWRISLPRHFCSMWIQMRIRRQIQMKTHANTNANTNWQSSLWIHMWIQRQIQMKRQILMQVQILMRIDLEQSLVAARACVGCICEVNCLETTAGTCGRRPPDGHPWGLLWHSCCDVLWCHVIRCDALGCPAMSCDALWCAVMPCDALRCAMMPSSGAYSGNTCVSIASNSYPFSHAIHQEIYKAIHQAIHQAIYQAIHQTIHHVMQRGFPQGD